MAGIINLNSVREGRGRLSLAEEIQAEDVAEALARDALAALLAKIGAPGQPPAGPALRFLLEAAARHLVKGEGYEPHHTALMALRGAGLGVQVVT